MAPAFRLSLRTNGISADGESSRVREKKRGLSGRRRQVHLKMVRVSNSIRLMQREGTCHEDLATTGQNDAAERRLFYRSRPLGKMKSRRGDCVLCS